MDYRLEAEYWEQISKMCDEMVITAEEAGLYTIARNKRIEWDKAVRKAREYRQLAKETNQCISPY